MNPYLKTPPAIEPVTLEELKDHLRVDSVDEDALLTGLIAAAREWCEGFQNRAYITQTLQLWLDEWPAGDAIVLPRPPLQSVASVKYYGTDDTEYTLDAADYRVSLYGYKGRVVLNYGKSWPSTTLRPAEAVVVEYDAGYGDDATDVPERARMAIKIVAAHLYENREVTDVREHKEIPLGVQALLGLERIWPL